jgi:hypothetical protein
MFCVVLLIMGAVMFYMVYTYFQALGEVINNVV